MSGDKARSSLNNKVMRLLGVVIAILLVGNGLIFAFVVWPTFNELERREGEQNAQRVAEALMKEEDDLGRSARDFSAWDATYEYVVKPNDEYDRQTFTVDVMRDLEMQLIGIYDTNGHRVRSMSVDLESGEEITIQPFTGDMPADHPLLAHDKTNGITGILLTEHGPMLLASFPILQSTREGPVRGSFFMGRLLSTSLIAALVDQTHVKFDVYRTDGSELSPKEVTAIAAISGGHEYSVDASDSDSLATYQYAKTMLDGAPLLIKAKTPRNISAIGSTTLVLATISTVITAWLVMAVIWIMLTRLIVAPLNKLTTHVVAVGQTGDLSRRLALDRNDEIGVLSKEFDAAAEQLGHVRRRLVEESYQSGMAEIAAGVIHNVRNALSPVVVTVSHLSEVAVMPPATHLDAAFADLKSEETVPERRRMLVEYVEAAMKAMLERGHRFAEDLRIVAEQNRHIEQILQDHSALSMDKRRLEPVKLSSVVQEASRLLPTNGSAIVDVRVAPSIETAPDVLGHPIVIAQILGNLMVNAAEAIQETGRVSGRIDIDAGLEIDSGREVVHLTVKDNGNGIDPEVLKNLFGRGFSTKKAKTGGIGLHWSANSIATMGGRMFAESKGIGRGASFHVVLPVSASPAASNESAAA
ncbi:MAG TPA: CHASE4 domain-containing protein [Dongiaceae bacterium]|jgi:sensor domain CHASE-containing protein|nr:CHASE4 domain-containing protein [Dongiaceae bacterium]